MAVKPCQTPGCNYPNYHVCLVGKPDTFPELLAKEEANGGPKVSKLSDSHRQAISEAQLLRWDRIRASRGAA